MPLTGFVPIPAIATDPGAPIDSFLMRTLRQNDALHENALAPLAQSLWLRNDGFDGPRTASSGYVSSNVVRATTFTVDANIVATAGVPIIIMASQSITINSTFSINANGAATTPTSGVNVGHVGGSGGGGGGGNAGGAITTPFSNASLVAGGATGSNPGLQGTNDLLLRNFSMLPMLLGGARGGNGGGIGGGIVVLVAPAITLLGTGGGRVTANGANGVAADSGGGGGGCILVITTTPTGFSAGADFTGSFTGTDIFQVNGGTANGAAGIGGVGVRMLYTMP